MAENPRASTFVGRGAENHGGVRISAVLVMRSCLCDGCAQAVGSIDFPRAFCFVFGPSKMKASPAGVPNKALTASE